MFNIKREIRLGLVILGFIAILSVFFFYLVKPVNGLVIGNQLTPNQSIYFTKSLLGGSITLNFNQYDSIPYTAIVNLSLVDVSNGGYVFNSSVIKQLSDTTLFGPDSGLVNVNPSINLSGITLNGKPYSGVTFNQDDTKAPWIGANVETYNFSSAKSYTIDLSKFNFVLPDIGQGNPRNYTLIFNFTWLCAAGTKNAAGTMCSSDTLFNLTNASNYNITVRSDNASFINNVQLINLSGGNIFHVNDNIYCNANVGDVDGDTPVVLNATFFGPSNHFITANGNPSNCAGTSWSQGKTCNISTQITTAQITKTIDIGQWNCSIDVFDGYSTNVSLNSTNVFTMNDTPPIFVGSFGNLSWNNGTNQTLNTLLASSATSGNGFYDPDSNLSFTVIGNHSINVTINTNNSVTFVGDTPSFFGNESIVFNASDGFYSVLSNNITLSIVNPIVCVSNWSCGSWGTCINGTQNKSCTDTNACNSSQLTTTQNQTCTVAPPPSPVQQAQNVQSTQSVGKTVETGRSTNISRNILIGFVVILVLAGIGAVVYLLSKNLKKKQTIQSPIAQVASATTTPAIKSNVINIVTEPVKKEETIIKPTNVDEMRKYIKNTLNAKIPTATIKEQLLKSGWSEKQINDELNIASLRTYIQGKLDQGMKKEAIKESLKLKGWKDEQIEEAFKDVGTKPLF